MIKYVKVNWENLEIAANIQFQIFPRESAYQEFIDCLNDKKEYNNYYIVYDNENIIGITGLYTTTDIKKYKTIWLGWFGVLEKYCNKNYGKKILLDTIEMSKKFMIKYDIKFFRIITSKTENKNAVILYDKIMDRKEKYTNKNDATFHNSCLIYTKMLGNFRYKKWNNEFLNIKEMIKKEAIGNQKYS